MPNELLLLRKELDAQRHAYAVKLPQQISRLERMLARVEQPPDVDSVEESRRLVRGLAGSSAIFGFRSVSEAAQILERALLDHQANWSSAPAERQRLRVHLETLIRAAGCADCDHVILAE